jgi:hypothetical protein
MKKKDIASSLVEEGLKEAADEFFGKRVRLESEVALLHELARELKKMESKVLHWRNLLHFLLLEGDRVTIAAFYSAIEIDVRDDELAYDPEEVKLEDIIMPFSLRTKTLYQKIVHDIYHNLAVSIEGYYRGTYYEDRMMPGKKILSIHYDKLMEMTKDLNRRIENNNTFSKASEILQFTKKLDVDAQDKERITDSGINYTLDEELRINSIRVEDYGLTRFTPLPLGKSVELRIHSFLDSIYREQKDRITDLMQRIRRAERNRLSSEGRGSAPKG